MATDPNLVDAPRLDAVEAPHDTAPPSPGAPAPQAAPEEPREVTAEDLAKEFGDDAPAIEPSPAAAKQPGQGEEGAGAPAEPPVRSQTAEQRIAELTARAHQAEREAARLRQFEPQAPAPAAPAAPAAPDPAAYDFGEADAKFIADSAAFHARAAAREEFATLQATRDAAASAAQQKAGWDAKIATGAAKYDDFAERVVQGANENKWPCTEIMAAGIVSSGVGEDVAYHLATNVADAQRIAALSPLEQAREMGRLEYRYELAKTPGVAVTTRTTKAPPPPSQRARGEAGQFAVPDDTNDFKAFERKYAGVSPGVR